MTTLKLTNIKCGGCEKRITDALAAEELERIVVDVATQQITFEGDTDVARRILSRLGYPEVGSREAQSLIKKGVSYLSCAIGRFGPSTHDR